MQRSPRSIHRPSSPARTARRTFAAATLGMALVLSACSGGGSKSSDNTLPLAKPNVVANDAVHDGGSVTMALEKDVPNFNSISADGSALETQEVVNGIFPTTFVQ